MSKIAQGPDALDKLSVRKRAYVAERAGGATIRAASASVGVSKQMGGKYESDSDVQAAYRELMRETFPMQKLAKLISGGANATTPVYDSNGRKKKDRPDWKTRKPYIEMASQQAGYFEKKGDTNNTLISVKVEHVGNKDANRTQPVITVATETI